ncbi:MAG TPA: hypothetical protein VFE25_12445 [Opitutaceae bacterium]|jgi:hypothetical protein|nr:hypothetical protein [Opitutaceae bacterium]
MNIVFIPFLIILALGVGSFFARSMTTKRAVTADRAKFQRKTRLLGTGILVAGLLIAASIYMQTVLDEQAADAAPGAERRQFQRAFEPAYTDKAQRAMKDIAGKEGVLGVEFTEWIQSLAHGKRLSYTVAVAGILGFLTCLVLAHPHLSDPTADSRPSNP